MALPSRKAATTNHVVVSPYPLRALERDSLEFSPSTLQLASTTSPQSTDGPIGIGLSKRANMVAAKTAKHVLDSRARADREKGKQASRRESSAAIRGQARVRCPREGGRYANSSGSYHFRFFQWFVEVTCASTAERADICARQERHHQ